METNQTGYSRLMSLVSSSAFWIAALLIAGLIGGLWFVLAEDPARKAAPLVAALAFTAAVGIAWRQSRVRARRRMQTAMDAYAEREIARAGQVRWKRRTAAVAVKALPGRDRLSA